MKFLWNPTMVISIGKRIMHQVGIFLLVMNGLSFVLQILEYIYTEDLYLLGIGFINVLMIVLLYRHLKEGVRR